MQIKRVVTAVDADGRSVFQEDAPVEPVAPEALPGTRFWRIWGTEGTITAPARVPAGSQGITFFPGQGGTRFGVLTMQPQPRNAAAAELSDAQTMASRAEALEEPLPGLLGHMETDQPGMHTTQTVDYDIVLAGTLTLELDDGAEVELPAGSCIVQNGTRHAWHNYGREPATLAYVIIDARPSDETGIR